ncbi:MAG: glycosyltransferase family 4 protein [Kiritimatiellae bacterium]|nr:glycosyltransferase family 4 protein [Kiritimatiellia bacterium]
MRIVLADQYYPHHSRRSGYGALAAYVPARALRADLVPWGRAAEGSRRWWISRKLFDARVFLAALRADVLHLLYFENHLRALPRLLRRLRPRLRLVGTLHQPVEAEDPIRGWARLRLLDDIITLTSGQAEEIRARLPAARVHFIPHGFVPRPETGTAGAWRTEPALQAVTVGANYRDWDALKQIMALAAARRADWRFHLVGLPETQKALFRSLPNAVVHPRLAEDAYFDLLDRCRALLLPMVFATANNALLEAHAAGLPAVCSALPGVADYATSTTRTFTTPEEAVALLGAAADAPPPAHEETRKRTAAEGQRFSWAALAPRILQVYRTEDESRRR